YRPKSEEMLFRVIRAAFEQRRKTLVNALSSAFPQVDKATLADVIVACGHRADIRGEKLDIADFTALADRLTELSTN
ncbi:MAG: 16S rRNA (adenine(1518)-N(6)/adenine(1519)-N(6))-dimethyltransferase, partial [Clostridia bacterium]|nr:16S rRNA (adenine(1518)-N(6)/adenine(1519)-N(6))-dimethyltransferase [Clostridia bacterium]